MRSVAHDMGQALGCGAHLESLRRTAVGEFTLEDAHTLEELAEAAGKRSVTQAPSPELSPSDQMLQLEDCFIHPRKLLPQFPSVTADELTTARIRAGRSINLPDTSRARQVKVFAGQRDLLCIATRVAGTLFHPKIVLCGAEMGGPDKCGTDNPVRRL